MTRSVTLRSVRTHRHRNTRACSSARRNEALAVCTSGECTQCSGSAPVTLLSIAWTYIRTRIRKQGTLQSSGMRPAVVVLSLALCFTISSVSHAQTDDLPRPQGRPAADESDADLPPYPEHAPPRPSGDEYKDQDHFWCASCVALSLYIYCTPW